MLCTTSPLHSPLYSQAHILILGVIMYSSFSHYPIWLPCTSSVHEWNSITGYDYVHNVFLGDNLFGQIDTLTTALNMYVKQTSSNVPLNLWKICSLSSSREKSHSYMFKQMICSSFSACFLQVLWPIKAAILPVLTNVFVKERKTAIYCKKLL